MRKRFMRCILPMDIQFFAEPGSGAGDGGSSGAGAGTQQTQTGGATPQID